MKIKNDGSAYSYPLERYDKDRLVSFVCYDLYIIKVDLNHTIWDLNIQD